MAVSIDIIPLSQSLDLHGEPDSNSAYSLSGHVAISLTSSSSFFDRRRPSRLLLQSLTVTFEGQSELVGVDSGYSAVRLCSVTRELVDVSDPVELTNDGHEDSSKPCIWNVVFDLTVPGWLPATGKFTDPQGDAGTRYALFATATVIAAEDDSSHNSLRSALSSICSPFRPRPKLVGAKKCEITVNRYICPPDVPPYASTSSALFPEAVYSVQARIDADAQRDDTSIPLEILSGVRVVACVPEHISLDEQSFPFSLRFRTDDTVSDADRRRLRISSFAVELEQTERYRTEPSVSYVSEFPIPPQCAQPPSLPLLSPHPAQVLYDLGLLSLPHTEPLGTRTFSILPQSHPGKFELAGDGYIFPDDSELSDDAESDESGSSESSSPAPKWFHVDTDIPFIRHDTVGLKEKEAGRLRDRMRETSRGPLFSAHHSLRVTLECTYDIAVDVSIGQTPGRGEPQRASELLHFSLPLSFVRVPPPMPRPVLSLLRINTCSSSPTHSVYHSPTSSVDSVTSPLLTPSSPYQQTLPPYSQLYHANGDRKVDYSVPLPIYSPSDEPSSSASFA